MGSLIKTLSYAVSGDFVFNNTLIEIASGTARLKDRKPAQATFYAGFHKTGQLDGDYGNGVLTASPTGAPVVANGKLNLKGSVSKYVDFNAVLNCQMQQVGCIRIKFTPNYSGAPGDSENKVIFNLSKSAIDFSNLIDVQHSPDGNIYWAISDQTATPIIALSILGAWSPIAGTEYEFELNFDITTGATRLFIDGVQLGATNVSTGTRSSDIGIIRLGSDLTSASKADMELAEFICFNAVQHTANFAGEIPRANQCQYSDASPSIIDAAAQSSLAILNFATVKTLPTNSNLKFVLNVDSVDKYWTGSSWATSSSVAQSNTEAEILANVTSLDLSAGASVKVKAYLISTYGDTRPVLTSYTYTYTFNAGAPASVAECLVYGWMKDLDGVAQAGITISAELLDYSKYNSLLVIGSARKQTVSNANGYWELLLTNNALMTAGTKYTFKFDGALQSFEETKSVPNQATVNYASL